PDGVLYGGQVGIADGRIVGTWGARESARPAAGDTWDVSGCWVLPGGVDAHVHCFSTPTEGFTAATSAAAAGGVTTIIEMPYDEGNPVTSAEVLAVKRELLARDAVVDVALLGTIRKTGGVNEIPGVAEG